LSSTVIYQDQPVKRYKQQMFGCTDYEFLTVCGSQNTVFQTQPCQQSKGTTVETDLPLTLEEKQNVLVQDGLLEILSSKNGCSALGAEVTKHFHQT
jgi:hypothetical protein